MKSIASRYGLRPGHGFARRWVAGATVEDAVLVAKQIEAAGLTQTVDYLAPTVRTMAEADTATRAFIGIINQLAVSGIGKNLSLKLTQFGLTVDRATCVDNLRRLLDPAAAQDFFVRIDMEDARYTQLTLDVFETLWQQNYRNIGAVIQASLRRSIDDVKRLNALGARVRLVKGAYVESRRIAYQSRAQVNRAFITAMELLLTEGRYPAIASHDPTLIDATKQFARSRGIAKERFEFQMLYGVSGTLQRALHADSYRVRIYLPFGGEWFPYVMRRLADRPADIGFVLRNVLLNR